MFRHLLWYRIKIMLREKHLVFWTLIFPFILSTLYYVVFSGMNSSASFSPIPIAVVDSEAYRSDTFFRQALSMASSGESKMLELSVCPDEKQAEQWLEQGKIRGYILAGTPIQLHLASSGLSQSMVKSFLDQYAQVHQAVVTILNQNPEALAGVIGQLGKGQNVLLSDAGDGPNANLVLIMYYALLAMTCMYGAYYGLSLVMEIQADLSARAARVNMASADKFRVFLAGLLASFILHTAGLLLFLSYLRWALGVDFGGRGLLVLATTLLGSLVGLALGAFIGVVIRGKAQIKVSVLTGVTLLGAFLAGMMFPGVKYMVSNAWPALNWINPVNLLADAYFALYYFDGYRRYGQNMGLLSIWLFLLCLGATMFIRRRQYVSL